MASGNPARFLRLEHETGASRRACAPISSTWMRRARSPPPGSRRARGSPRMMPELGLIEGRFGRIWSEEERGHVVQTLAAAGYGFYHYGPKADRALRRAWRQRHDPEQTAMLVASPPTCVRRGCASASR
jgi:hypothetical protein